MSERLRVAYQRLEARRVAIEAVTGNRIVHNKRFMQRVIKDPKQPVEHLRKVGNVQSDTRRYGDTFGEGPTGWYTDPDGYYSKDGTGLCWGEVWQLPGRKGKSRFIAGYHFGGCDGGPTMDFTQIFECDTSVEAFKDTPAVRDAARYADRMAEEAADEEREYQRKYREDDDDAA